MSSDKLYRYKFYIYTLSGADQGGGLMGTAPSWHFKGGVGPPPEAFRKKD